LASSHYLSDRPKWQYGLAVAAAAFIGFLGWHYFGPGRPKQAQKPTPVPVTFATAQKADYPVYLNGLGTVQPFDTVTVRSRVDGEVTSVAFKQGQIVKEGDILVQIDPRPYQAALDQAIAKKAQDEATLANAQIDLQRYVSLANQNAGTRQQLDTQKALIDQLNAQIKGDQGAIDNAQTQVIYTTIRSPLTGRAGFRLIDPGNIVHAADTTGIVTIVRMQPISIVFTAPEEDLPRINQALANGTVAATAFSSDGLRTLAQGKLALLNNAVDQASGTISMKASFDNKDNALWPGLSVTTRLLVDTLKQVTVVPEDAVQRGPNGLFTFVIGDDNKVQIRQIKVAQEGHGQSVISDGISPGQKVVTAGQYRLQQGTLVDAKEEAPQNAPAQASATTAVKVP
jgi:membrane fusion protein, multidrug efflux system